MLTVKVLNKEGNEVSEVELKEAIFDIEIKEHLVHQAVVHYLANQRQGTKSTKTRAEVRGGGRKPWRQKGTGRARQGSTRSPQWKGGGVVFAPKPRDFSFKLNRKVKRIALKSVLTAKVRDNKFIVIDELNMTEIKTKAMLKVLDNVKANKALIVLSDTDKNAYLSIRNLENFKSSLTNTINVYDILAYDQLIVTKQSLEKIQEVYV